MYIVIEAFPDPTHAAIVVDPDTGLNLVYHDQEIAQMEANECQDGVVVEV